jgi:Fe2+ or Zn2+ uptake regulation protein
MRNQILDVRTGPKPIGRLIIPSILQILQEAGHDLRAWTITVRVRQLLNRSHLRWETVHKYLEQMVKEQMIFRYEDPTGIVTYSKNPIVREKVLF